MSMRALPHRLAAVWFADILGYGRLSSQNENEALQLVGVFQNPKLLLGIPLRDHPRPHHGCAAAAWVSLLSALLYIAAGLALGYSLACFAS